MRDVGCRSSHRAKPQMGWRLFDGVTERWSHHKLRPSREAIYRKLLAPSSLWLGDNLRNQAISLYQQARYAESLNKVTETLKIYLETFGTHYDQYPTALIIQGLSQAKTGQLKEGEKILREAVKIRTESLPKEHYWVALANSALGDCLTIQQRYNEADPLLLGSYESLKNSQGANNPRTRLGLQRLVELYEKWCKVRRHFRLSGLS
jgi:tetratricopeptide (TPR) repeat protein